MVDSVFGNLDNEATKAAFKKYLQDWKKWKLKSLQRFPGLKSPSMDGQPNDGTPHDPDQKFVNHAEAVYQYKTRIKCCAVLMSVGEEEEILGDILLHRFIKGWSAVKTMNYINEQYNAYMSERTFRMKQEQALWEGALMCPDESVRIKR
ncbi:hypothetical protein [Limosilactobacillus vaginalis]|uniref:hypothetical protein n=1 Tax=Limosilactobacillus vaginalis TaxID=1633 RepID=UPI0011DDD5D2|nr:hypothetical protein [Limosilactobacillus vaginalis]DAH72957.1 MAG TPA: hypothetical protein [Caudoviricetes sp.]